MANVSFLEDRQAFDLPHCADTKIPELDVEVVWQDFLAQGPALDSRRIQEGDVMPTLYYADQPYVVRTQDGALLTTITTGNGHEGQAGQHVITMRSEDLGKTWAPPVAVEPADGPEASWGVLFIAPSGRIFIFYVYNADNLREFPTVEGGVTPRMDSLGYFVFRWSDDHGRSWSAERVTIPVREFDIDRENISGGKVRLFWNVGGALLHGDAIILPLHKVGGLGTGWFTRSEGAFVTSQNLILLDNPAEATWETLPLGDRGIRTPAGGGPVAEEHCLVKLSDGSLMTVFRTIDGHPACSYSRDGAKNWCASQYLQDRAGRLLKHPRAATFAWALQEGGYVLWFHNHGGSSISRHPRRAEVAYDDRNPVWMARGFEVKGKDGPEVVWDMPEIALYDDDPAIRTSYPDLFEEDGCIYVTETQKSVARIHRLGDHLALALKKGAEGFSARSIGRSAVFEWTPESQSAPKIPPLPKFLKRGLEGPYGTSDQRAGFSIELLLDFSNLQPGQNLITSGEELSLDWKIDGSLQVTLSDGRTTFLARSSPIEPGGLQHVVLVVDGGPKVVTFVRNGVLDNRGEDVQFGWARFSPHFRGLLWKSPLRLTAGTENGIQLLRLYGRLLLSAEAGALAREALSSEYANG